MAITGKQIINDWGHQYLSVRKTISLDQGSFGGITDAEWRNLIDRIDVALREARQEGLDHRKSKKLLSEDQEFGPFWQRFYVRGCLNASGLAEAFNCKANEDIWLDQWNEVIRVGFKKPSLRAVDPFDFLESVKLVMDQSDYLNLKSRFDEIVADLAKSDEPSHGPSWSPAKLKGK